jgi:hypothetical protein
VKNDAKDASGEEPPRITGSARLGPVGQDRWSEPDPAKQNSLFNQILDICGRQTADDRRVGRDAALCIVKNGVKNFAAGFRAMTPPVT